MSAASKTDNADAGNNHVKNEKLAEMAANAKDIACDIRSDAAVGQTVAGAGNDQRATLMESTFVSVTADGSTAAVCIRERAVRTVEIAGKVDANAKPLCKTTNIVDLQSAQAEKPIMLEEQKQQQCDTKKPKMSKAKKFDIKYMLPLAPKTDKINFRLAMRNIFSGRPFVSMISGLLNTRAGSLLMRFIKK